MTRGLVTEMRTCLNRRQLLRAGVGAILTAAVIGAMAASVLAHHECERVEGSWWVQVHVDEPAGVPDFDVTYGFAEGGVFTRIDGRSGATSLGTWKRTEDGKIVIALRVFHFTQGVRDSTIFPVFIARVVDGTLTGTFTAVAHPEIPGFPSSGTFTGTRILAEAP
jgi:hypothetical protein